MRTRAIERIDQFAAIRPLSQNVEGHEDRMKAHCERVQQELRKYRMIRKIIQTLYKRAENTFNGEKAYKDLKKNIITSRRIAIKDIKKAYLG